MLTDRYNEIKELNRSAFMLIFSNDYLNILLSAAFTIAMTP
jgi:hypothetical protein